MTSDGTASDAPIKAPGVAAWLRRQGDRRRPLAIGAIAGGAVLFVIASMTTPLAGADTTHRHGHRSATGPDLSMLLPLTEQSSTVMVSPSPSPSASSRGTTRRAPVPPAVSGLAANGIPMVALNAYRVAAARMDHADPGCGIDWALLAGIGRVESDHGRFGGAVLRADGTSSPRIIGPALDGIHYTYVPAPANGAELDGDAQYAHALGPMQFIPQTWAGYGADANGDGVADVFNINDAALGAARYLCAAGGDLRSPDGAARAVLAYNHVAAYVSTVLALADAYRRGVSISGIPIGNISGALPPVKHTGTPPPANPGGPTAVESGGRSAASSSSTPTASPSKSAPAPAASTSAGGSSTAPAPSSSSSSSAPVPTPTLLPSPSPSPSPTPSTTPTSSPTPTPSPSTSCDPVSHLLHRC